MNCHWCHYLQKNILLVGCLMALLVQGSAFACGPQTPEDFAQFIKSFNTNKEFAVSRTLYSYIWTVEYEEETNRNVITKEGDSAYPPLAESARNHEMLLKIESVSREEAIMKMYAPNTGWSFRYNFLNKEGCWYLKSVTEISM